MVHSLCPAIYGHEVVKAGLLLSLFGGCPRKSGEKNKIAVRSDAHVLVVGQSFVCGSLSISLDAGCAVYHRRSRSGQESDAARRAEGRRIVASIRRLILRLIAGGSARCLRVRQHDHDVR